MNDQSFLGMVDLVTRLSEGPTPAGKQSLLQYCDMLDFVEMLEKQTTIQESDSDSEALNNRREEYMDDLKEREDYFKEKYGDVWESVMYGTATNLAKKDLGMD